MSTAKVLMKGNEALAEAAIRAGCRHFFGYPITPQNELAAYMSKRMPQVEGIFLQAESEISAINMVYGASAAGARVMTSSSSPGISLKSEGISYLAAADLPAVIINVQRGGPGLGSIQPSQADYWQATRAMGHGDFHILVFAPSTVQEMADMAHVAFEVSDRYRVPAMILADGLLGQMMEPVALPEEMDLAKLPVKDWALSGTGGVRPPLIVNSMHLQSDELEATNLERFERYAAIKAEEQRVELYRCEDAEVVAVAFGACARVAKSAIDLARDAGIKAGLMRPLTLWPWPERAIEDLIAAGNVRAFLSIEMSLGQMVDDIRLTVNGRLPVEFYGRTGGMIPEPQAVKSELAELLARCEAAEGGDA